MKTMKTNPFRLLAATAALFSLLAVPAPARATDPQPEAAEGRASRWTGQLTRLTNRKAEAQDNASQLRASISRQENLRGALEQERDQKVQQMIRESLKFAGGAETNGGAFGRGLLGGFATRLVADEYNARIATVNSNIATLRKNQGDWEAEARWMTEWSTEMAGWPTYRGHRYPIVQEGDIVGVAKGLDIRKGDLFLSYNGTSMAYATGADLSGPRDEAARKNIEKVEAVFVRDGKVIRYTVPGGKPLGVMVKLPIHE